VLHPHNAYILFPLWWEQENFVFFIGALVCLVGAMMFGMFVLKNILGCFTRVGPVKLVIMLGFASALCAWFSSLEPDNPAFWASLIFAGATFIVAIGAKVYPRWEMGLEHL
jgi:hypothetical protein